MDNKERIEKLEEALILIQKSLDQICGHTHFNKDYTYVEDLDEFIYENYQI